MITPDMISANDKLQCVERELKMRQNAYPRWVETGKISAGKSEWEIAVIAAIVADYQAMVENERLL